MNQVDFDIRYVNEFETTEEYLGYLEQLYSISPDIFLRYSTELQKHSMRLLSGESQDMNAHILTNYMVGVCHGLQYSHKTVH
ncbi:hypothetical protein [Paraburkholderia aromaticivorans]|uniref:hypothetical protein n=1 Tax=Paraburkholderia aromaticivorans TaxID=2026199 RepID=UPI0038BDEF21